MHSHERNRPDDNLQYDSTPDLLIAPVIEPGADTRCVILPGDRPSRHVWSGLDHAPGENVIAAPIGRLAVFYRPDSVYAGLFDGLREIVSQ